MKCLLAALLVFPLVLRAQELDATQTAELLSKLAASRAGRAFEADFAEKKILPMWKDPIVESGTIAFEPPDKFLRKSKSLVVNDGKTLWMYYPEFRQVEKYPVDGRGPGQIFVVLGRALQFDSLGEMFQVSSSRSGDGFRLDLVPKSGAVRRMIRGMTLEIGPSLQLRSSVMLGKEGDRIETKYSNEKQIPLGAGNFSFQPPPGANVIAPLGEGSGDRAARQK